MTRDDPALLARLEAILIVAETPLSVTSLATAVSAPISDVQRGLAALVAEYDGNTSDRARGFELRDTGGGWRLYVREAYDDLVAEHIGQQAPTRLSQAALETLAVIAYKQPVSRSQVASIRAVNVDSVVRTLVARGLVTEVSRDDETSAVLYGTTDTLLEHLGIGDLSELPRISPLLEDGDGTFEEVV